MPIPRPERQDARVIAHVDMDCFYVQVEQRKQPALRGLPTAVVQYNSWKGGGLIAVSYEARKFGVKRSMRGDEAKKICPNIQLIQVPVTRGKADLNLYRSAGSEVVSILATKGRCERASIDEVYLDLTDAAESMILDSPPELLEVIDENILKSHVLGLPNDDNTKEENVRAWFCRIHADHQDRLLACGAIIVAQLRARVLEETKFTCSAGIAHNKMLAKLTSGMHKPAQQTIVPSSSVTDLLASLPVKKIKQLGGKLGNSVQADLGVNTVGDLLHFSKEKLQERYGINTGTWLWNVARGISGEEVEGRLLPKSHGCGKTFPGPQALQTMLSVEHWLNQLCEELSERVESDLDQNKRVAHTLTLHARAFKASDLESHRKFPSKSCPFRYGTVKIQEDAMRLFDSGLREFLGTKNDEWGITSLSVAASKILDTPPGTCSILKFFKSGSPSTSTHLSSDTQEGASLSTSGSKSYMTQDHEEEHHMLFYEGPCTDNGASGYDKILKNIGKWDGKPKHKQGKNSILRFFPCSNSPCSPTRLDSSNSIQDKASISPDEESNPEFNQVESLCAFEEGSNGVPDQDLARERSAPWSFNVADIDPSVIDELPLEMQKEVRGWLHPTKRAKTAKRGSSIAHYFSSVKKSKEPDGFL